MRLTKSQLISRRKNGKKKNQFLDQEPYGNMLKQLVQLILGAPTHPGKKKEVKEYSKI